jgi:hypothetical protein
MPQGVPQRGHILLRSVNVPVFRGKVVDYFRQGDDLGSEDLADTGSSSVF